MYLGWGGDRRGRAAGRIIHIGGVRIVPQPSGEICDLRNELYEGARKYVYAYGLRWGSRLPPGLAGNPTRLSLASVGPTAPSTEENSTLEGWRLLPKKLLSIRCYPTFRPFLAPLSTTTTTLGHNRAVYRFGSGWVRRWL